LQEPGHDEPISFTITRPSKSKGNATDVSRCGATTYREPTRKALSHQNNNLQITITTDILTPHFIPVSALKFHSDMILKPTMSSIDVQTRTARWAVLWRCY